MKMHFLEGGRLRMRRSIYVSGAAKEETIELPVHATLMRHIRAMCSSIAAAIRKLRTIRRRVGAG